MTRRIGSVLFGLILAGCGGTEVIPEPEMSNAERGQIQAEVLGWADAWLAASTGLDAQAAGALLDPADAHLMTAAGYLGNWQAAISTMTEHFLGLAAWDAQWTMRRVDVLGPDVALFVGEASGTVRLADGQEGPNSSVFSFVVRRVDGTWKGLFGHQSSVSSESPQ